MKPEPRQDGIVAARRAMQALINWLGEDLPPHAWNDAFVLGFIYGAAVELATQVSAPDDEFQHLSATYLSLFEGDAEDIMSRSASLHLSKDDSFLQGLDNARRFVGAMRRTPAYKDDATVIQANRNAQQAVLMTSDEAPFTYDEVLGVFLYDSLFASELRRRFPGLVKKPD